MFFRKTSKFVLAGALLLTPVLATGTASAASATNVYTVHYGDTMYKIAQKYRTSLTTLVKANPQIRNINNIWPGMRVNVPVAAQPATTPASSQSTYAQQVAALVNQQRANAGLAPLKVSASLSAMAMDKASDMYNKGYFDHTSPTYGSPFDMMNRYGISYRYAGENIAKGQQSPQQVMNDWMNSSGHRANILNANFTTIGVAYYKGEWVQEFTG